MKINKRSFPYPVLMKEQSDYQNANFSVELHLNEMADRYQFDADFNLSCPPLEQLIAEGRAEYGLHIECSATAYREFLHKGDTHFRHTIEQEKLCGTIEINAMVIAMEPIAEYDGGESISPEFAGLKFSVPRGALLAVEPLDPLEALRPLCRQDEGSPVICIYQLTESGDVPMKVEYDQEILMIGLEKTQYTRYLRISTNPALWPVLNAMLVFPALVYALEQLRDEGILNESQNLLWLQTLSRSIESSGGSLEYLLLGDDAGSQTSIEIAQMLLERPVSIAFENLLNFEMEEAEE